MLISHKSFVLLRIQTLLVSARLPLVIIAVLLPLLILKPLCVLMSRYKLLTYSLFVFRSLSFLFSLILYLLR